MPYSIPNPTKILTLAATPFLFNLVSFLCLLRRTFFPEITDVHIQRHIHQKDLNLCMLLYGRLIVEEKNKEFNFVDGVCNLTK